MNDHTNKSLAQTIDELASQCVKCGLCLPHCPTYQISADENESPRGRIALMQALAKEQLQPDKKVVDHLERCLTCRHCERVCPAHVQYGELITTGRTWLQQQPKHPIKHSFKTRLLSRIVQKNKNITRMGKLLRLTQVTGLRALGRYTGITFMMGLRPLDKLLPKVPSQKAFKNFYPTQEELKGEVALFLGCLSRWCDRKVVEASIYVLNACGYHVHIPANQGCCGAMAMHQGLNANAKRLIDQNVQAFNEAKLAAILTTASGCGGMLKEANLYFPNEQTDKLSSKIHDVSHFIADAVCQKKLLPLNYTVALHTPCTLQNCIKESQSAKDLLSSIPGLHSFDITEKDTCCGSAGSYMLENPIWANKLAQSVLRELKNTPVDYVATSNIGCALHLRRSLRAQNGKIQVVHPIVLVAMSLGWNDNGSKS